MLHRINGKLYTESNGLARYQYAEIDLFFSRWSTSDYEFYGNFDTAGIGRDWSLVTCTYNGEKWWALRHTNTQAVSMYFMGSELNINFSKVHYYTSNTGTVVNSEVNSSIASKGDSISVRSVNGSPYALQKDINALSSVYVKKAGDEMTGRLQLKNPAEFSIRMATDTSNYRRGIIWNNTASDTRIAEIGYQNTVQRIFLNPLGSTEVWSDVAGKYSFIIGNNFLTYNTWTILHSNNSTNYASGSVKVADSSIDNINNTNRAGSSRVNFFETYGSGDIMPTTYGNTMEICSTLSLHWQPQLYFSSGKGGHIYYRNKDYNISGFGSWKQLIDSENYSSILNSTYVKKAGDTMTGNLVVGSTSTFGGEATFNGGMYSGNIFPLSNNNYRIGSSSNRFIDAYIQTWVYANSGLYMNPSGITQNGSYLELSSGGNEIIIAGGTDFYVNYRGASYGGRSVPKKWYWRTGSGSSWANMEFGDCTLHGWINSTGISASGANSFNVGARFSNTSNDSIEIVGGNYTMGLGCHSNGSWFWWRGTANPTISTNKSYVMAYDGSTWAFTGSITATAAITAKATSDFRLKENYDGLIDYRERLLKLGRVYDYNYNKKALDLYQDRIDNKRHTGLVYQNAVKAGITNFCHEKDEYGYGSLNYLSPDLIATIIGSVQANILSIRLVESEQERMRKELEHAKSEINRLKGLVASLQN